MKCPKCGSEMIKRPSVGVYSCTNGKCYHNEYIEDIEQYQARLDKVLSKFENNVVIFIKTTRHEGSYENYGATSFVKYENDTFYLGVSDDFESIHREISLDTVESLIADLERNE
jgi:hypothetical protein